MQVFGSPLDVFEIVEKFPFSAWLLISLALEFKINGIHIHAGQHPPLTILSKDSASGIPFGVTGMDFRELKPSDVDSSELPDVIESCDPLDRGT